MPAQLGNILLDTQILNKAEVSGVIVDTLNTVENIVAEAVSTAWKAGGSKPASAFDNGALLIEANEGKVYNLSDALTITDQNKQYFTENAEGTYPAGTNIAVIETTPAVYAAAYGTAVSGTKYYAKNGNYYTEVPVQAGDSVEGLYVRTSQPVYKYDVLAGTDAANVKQINMGDNSAGNQLTPVNGLITIPFASGAEAGATPTNGLISSGDMDHLNSIESGANIGFDEIYTDDGGLITANYGNTSLTVSGGTGIVTRSGDHSHATYTLIVEASNATSSDPGVTKLYNWIDESTDGAATPKAVSGAVSSAVAGLRNYSSVTWKKADAGSTTTFTSGTASPTSNDASLTVKAESPLTISGTAGSVTLGARTATGTYAGVTKLYADLTGTNKDGSVTQSGVKAAVDGLRNYSSVTTKYSTWVMSGASLEERWTSGQVAPASNGSELKIYGYESVQVSINGTDRVTIGVARPNKDKDWPGVVTLNDTVGSSSGANKGIAASPLMVTNSMLTRVKKSIALSGLRQVSNDTQTPIPSSINSTDMPNTLYGLIKALKFAANHAS